MKKFTILLLSIAAFASGAQAQSGSNAAKILELQNRIKQLESEEAKFASSRIVSASKNAKISVNTPARKVSKIGVAYDPTLFMGQLPNHFVQNFDGLNYSNLNTMFIPAHLRGKVIRVAPGTSFVDLNRLK